MRKLKEYIATGDRHDQPARPAKGFSLKAIGIGFGLLVALLVILLLLAPTPAERAQAIVSAESGNQLQQLQSASERVLEEVEKLDPALAVRERARRHKDAKAEANRPAKEREFVEEIDESDDADALRSPNAVELTKFATASKYKVEQLLRDPASATYDDVVVYRHPNPEAGYVFCGRVNANNGFGGMAGPERFVATPVVAALESMDRSAFQAGWDQFCVQNRFVDSAAWF